MLKPASSLMAACLLVSSAVFFSDSASAEVPYYGILRGFESGDVYSLAGFDIAVDESGIYIVGEFFKAAGYGPAVLFLNADHSFRCSKVLAFRVDDSRGTPRAAGYSVALNENHAIVAGVYGEWPSFWHVARLFVAIFDKNNCELLSIRELLDEDKEWANLYHLFVGAGVKVLWDDNTDSIYLMLQTLGTTAFTQGSLYLFHLDQSLNLLSFVRYDNPDPTWFFVSDMVMDDAFLHLVGVQEKKSGDFVLTHLLVSKPDLSIQRKIDVSVDFPGYAMSSKISLFMPPRVYASYNQFYEGYVLYIAFNILCSGVDCSEDGPRLLGQRSCGISHLAPSEKCL